MRAVMAELHGEKIDIVDWSEDPADFVGHALSPARVASVTVVDAEAKAARVVVPDYQLSLAIGREGQNARLAARLTGWRIDIVADTDQRDAVPAATAGGESGGATAGGESGGASEGSESGGASAAGEPDGQLGQRDAGQPAAGPTSR